MQQSEFGPCHMLSVRSAIVNVLKCFDKITLEERECNIQKFKLMQRKDDQMQHLVGLISIVPVARRKPRKPEDSANLNDYSYNYKVRIIKGEEIKKIRVCHKAFMSLHGVTNRTLQTF